MTTFEELEAKELFSKGFDRGNYGAAYELQDWDSWYAENCGEESDAYRDGLLLGFFSSFEIHEIGDPDVAECVEALRVVWDE